MNSPSSVDLPEPVSEPLPLPGLIDGVITELASGTPETLSGHIGELKPAEIAELLQALPPRERQALWEEIPKSVDHAILPNLGGTARTTLLNEMEEEELFSVAEMMPESDLALILDTLPQKQTERLLQTLDEDHRTRVEQIRSFVEGSAGRIMSSDVVSVRKNVTFAVVLRWLRHHRALPPFTDALMVVDERGHYLGRVEISDILTGAPNQLVEDNLRQDGVAVTTATSAHEVARLFERRDLVMVAVVDDEGRLVGRITVNEAVELIRAESEEQLRKRAGLSQQEELFAPVLPSARRRAFWLGINLMTVFLAAWVIGNFAEALDKIVALAILMPVVASMGGIAGSQTLALTLRGIVLDQLAPSNIFWLARKEILVGLLNGITWAVVVGVVAWLWFGSWGIGVIIAVAMVLNLVAATASGVLVPIALKRLGVDPALSGAVVLTTVTDVVGFLSFLGLATLFLL